MKLKNEIYDIEPFRIEGSSNFLNKFKHEIHWFDPDHPRIFIWGDFQIGKTKYIIELVSMAHKEGYKTLILSQNITAVVQQTRMDFIKRENQTHQTSLIPVHILPPIKSNSDIEKLAHMKSQFMFQNILDLGNSNNIINCADYLDNIKKNAPYFYESEIKDKLVLIKDEGDLFIPYLIDKKNYSKTERALRRLEDHCRFIIDISATLFPSLYTTLKSDHIDSYGREISKLIISEKIILIPNDVHGYKNQFDCILHDLNNPFINGLNICKNDEDLQNFFTDISMDDNNPMGLITIDQNIKRHEEITEYVNAIRDGNLIPIVYNGNDKSKKSLADLISENKNFGTPIIVAGKMIDRGIRCSSSNYSDNLHVTHQIMRISKKPNYPNFGQKTGRICGVYGGEKDRHLYVNKGIMEQFRRMYDFIPKIKENFNNNKDIIQRIVLGEEIPSNIKLRSLSHRHEKGMNGEPIKNTDTWEFIGNTCDGFFLSKFILNEEEGISIMHERYGNNAKYKIIKRVLNTRSERDRIPTIVRNSYKDHDDINSLIIKISYNDEEKLIFSDNFMYKNINEGNCELNKGTKLVQLKIDRSKFVLDNENFNIDMLIPGYEVNYYNSSQLYFDL